MIRHKVMYGKHNKKQQALTSPPPPKKKKKRKKKKEFLDLGDAEQLTYLICWTSYHFKSILISNWTCWLDRGVCWLRKCRQFSPFSSTGRGINAADIGLDHVSYWWPRFGFRCQSSWITLLYVSSIHIYIYIYMYTIKYLQMLFSVHTY